ncbi:MAG: putative lipid II flippase FtsW [Terracidiphilus sp.]|jgi:cell division protein FtsW
MPKRIGGDKWLFFATLLLVVAGLAMVFSASAVVAQEKYHSEFAFVGKQALWALAGMGALLLLSRIEYRVYNTPAFIYTALSVTTCLLVLVFLMPGSHNTHRWIRFGGLFTLQPSELAKPVLVLFLAWFLSTRLARMGEWKSTVMRAALIPAAFIVLIVAQPDLGTALVLAGVTALMFFLAGIRWKILVGGVCLTLPPLAALLIFVPWRLKRVLVFLHPNCDAKEIPAASYHVCQSLIAVGAGGVTGRGYMEGVQKLFFLPEAHTDFIFANIGEELGLIGSVIIVLLFVVFGYRGLRVAFRVQDPFARLAAFGITTVILIQAFFNISVVLALVPTKGIPLPLISSGGTSVFVTLASIGILLNISRKAD